MANHLVRSQGLRRERMLASPRYADGTFHNTRPVAPKLKKGTATPTLREFLCGGQRRTPPGPLPSRSPLDAWSTAPETGLRATWLGHSTVLLEIDGRRVLTDPVWGERASPVSFAGPRRFQPVPVPIAALPPLDAVVLSHDHYDHLDAVAVRELARMDVPFVTSLGVGAHLESYGAAPERITELDWWERVELPGGLAVTATPSQHFSGRGLTDRNATLWSSIVIEGPRHRIFFSGDTGLTPEYQDIRARLGPFDLVMLEVGAFHPAWGDIHLGPENALAALELLGGGSFLPIHWGTFNLAMHAWDEPAETLLSLGPKRGARLVMPTLGEPVEPSRVERIDPWWRAVAAQEKAGAVLAEEAAVPEGVSADEKLPWPVD
jgi:L-ascorbate metabolism protein UlaG (beta-lactamase superfamily)